MTRDRFSVESGARTTLTEDRGADAVGRFWQLDQRLVTPIDQTPNIDRIGRLRAVRGNLGVCPLYECRGTLGITALSVSDRYRDLRQPLK